MWQKEKEKKIISFVLEEYSCMKMARGLRMWQNEYEITFVLAQR